MRNSVRHKTFIPYDHRDQAEVDRFIHDFDHGRDVMIARAVGSDETMESLVGGDDPDYIMRQIREKYMGDSTVTLVFIGEETWCRKFVDWELAASLHQGPSVGKPNGVIGILSPSLSAAILPDRLLDNLATGFAKIYPYPSSVAELAQWIEEAFESRENLQKCKLVKNGRTKLKRNLNPANDLGDRKPVCPDRGGVPPLVVSPAVVTPPRQSVEPRQPYLSFWEESFGG